MARAKRLHSRRKFLTASSAAAAGALGRWAPGLIAQPAARTERVRFPVIDSHTHFYDPKRPQGVPWPPREDKLLYRTVLPASYRALPVELPVAGTVVVEASSWVEDNDWVLDLAAREKFIVGFVGNLPVGTKQFAGHVNHLAENRIFRGIRLSGDRLKGSLSNAAFLSDLKLLESLGLSLDLVGGMEVLAFAARLASEAPRLRIIIDHLSGLPIDGKPPPVEWVDPMRRLAGRPEIFFKVSGLVEGTGRADGTAPADAGFYSPVLDAMVAMFGAHRLIYASNWPVSERFAPLSVVEKIIADYFGARGRDAEEQVFWKSSKAAYRWTERRG
jgi:predicted TIM-barrel fold metal-dependent hydrolase